MSAADPRAQLIAVCRQAADKGFMAGGDGNVSMLLESGRVLITPTASDKANLSEADLLEVDRQGRLCHGLGRPSAETSLHLAAYRARPEVRAVVHAHSPFACAWAACGQSLPMEALPEVLYHLGRIPSVPYATPGSPELAQAVEPLLREHCCLLLDHHGSLASGADLAQAWLRAQKIEQAALTLLAAQQLGGAVPLPLAEQEKLRALGRAHAGQAPGASPVPAPPPLAQRFEMITVPLTAAFAVEKRHTDARGQVHLIVDDKPLRRVGLLTLNAGAGYRGGHFHLRKHEGFYIVSGRALCQLACPVTGERLDLELEPGTRMWLEPGVAHRFQALTDLTFVEFTDRSYEAEDDRPYPF